MAQGVAPGVAPITGVSTGGFDFNLQVEDLELLVSPAAPRGASAQSSARSTPPAEALNAQKKTLNPDSAAGLVEYFIQQVDLLFGAGVQNRGALGKNLKQLLDIGRLPARIRMEMDYHLADTGKHEVIGSHGDLFIKREAALYELTKNRWRARRACPESCGTWVTILGEL